MKTFVSLFLAVSICFATGCASRAGMEGERGGQASGSSGITVFGTIDAAVSGTRSK